MPDSALVFNFFSLFCAFVMGVAIQRGSTCTYTAFYEALNHKNSLPLRALGYSALWVSVGLALAIAIQGEAPLHSKGYGINALTVLGGVLLGVGAFVNKACTFGSIAKLGAGHWAYAAMPIGFFAGCLLFEHYLAHLMPDILPPLLQTPPIVHFYPIILGAAALWAVLKIASAMKDYLVKHRSGKRCLAQRRAIRGRWVWTPSQATFVIALCFLCLYLRDGAWSYPSVLMQLAQQGSGTQSGLEGKAPLLAWHGLLALALWGGAIAAGLQARHHKGIADKGTADKGAAPRYRLDFFRPDFFKQVGRCFAGGAIMAWGSLLIPGSNDSLLLLSLPLMWLYGLIALASMGLTLIALQRLQMRAH
jgi:toxin CptA